MSKCYADIGWHDAEENLRLRQQYTLCSGVLGLALCHVSDNEIIGLQVRQAEYPHFTGSFVGHSLLRFLQKIHSSWNYFTYTHTRTFTHRRFSHIHFTHRCFYTQTLLVTGASAHRRSYTQAPLHRVAFTHRCLYTQAPLHTEAFTHRRFYTHMHLRTHLLRNILSNYWCGMHRTCKNTSVKPDRNGLMIGSEKLCEEIFLRPCSKDLLVLMQLSQIAKTVQ